MKHPDNFQQKDKVAPSLVPEKDQEEKPRLQPVFPPRYLVDELDGMVLYGEGEPRRFLVVSQASFSPANWQGRGLHFQVARLLLIFSYLQYQ